MMLYMMIRGPSVETRRYCPWSARCAAEKETWSSPCAFMLMRRTSCKHINSFKGSMTLGAKLGSHKESPCDKFLTRPFQPALYSQ